MKKTESKESTIDILRINEGQMTFNVLGVSPLIMNRMSEKARHTLLMPSGPKSRAEKQSTLKHEPLVEFRASPYTDPDEKAPTLLLHLATAFKGAMKEAALDLDGVAKTQIGRLVWVTGDRLNKERTSIYGVPQLLMSVVRSADMNKTPDIRSRAIVPQWAATITIHFRAPILKEQGIANLIAAAGSMGVGDWRPAKGSGTSGRFELVGKDDPTWLAIVKGGGRKAQVAAMEFPECYDADTQEMLSWFETASKARGFGEAPKNGKAERGIATA